MDVSSYLNELRSSISMQVRLLELLKKRIEINDQKLLNRSLTEEEKIEIEIASINTMGEMETLKKIIKEKEAYFQEYSEYFEADLKEANDNWESIVARAKQQIQSNSLLKPYLDAISEADVEINADLDKKVFLYKRIKALLYGR